MDDDLGHSIVGNTLKIRHQEEGKYCFMALHEITTQKISMYPLCDGTRRESYLFLQITKAENVEKQKRGGEEIRGWLQK